MVAVNKPLTVEAFWERYADARYELVKGEPVAMTPNSVHSDIAALIAAAMVPYVMPRKLGRVKVEAHYQLGEKTVRVADVSFLSQARQNQITEPEKFIPFAPELVIEIISPSETQAITRGKMKDYREAGVEVMWLVYPHTREVEVHYLPANRSVRFGLEDTLRLDAVLPGFELPLRQIFVD